MQSRICFKKVICFSSLTCILLIVFSYNLLFANNSSNAFTDPSKQFQLPEEWIKKPITYDSWAKGADIAITLDQHLYPALLPMIQEYAKKNDLDIRVNEGTCGISAGMIKNKSVDISGYCCPAGKTDRLPGLKFHTLGIAPLRILVHSDNPIENVSLEQVRGIFSGDISNWSKLKTPGGENGPNLYIQPIGRLHCKARPGHWRLILDNEELFGVNLEDVGSISEMIYAVAANKSAVGYEMDWMIKRYQFEGKVKSLKIDGFSPDDHSNLLSKDYPFYRTYVITTWEGEGLEKPEVKKLVDYILNNFKTISSKYDIIDFSLLKENGWQFLKDELIGEPVD